MPKKKRALRRLTSKNSSWKKEKRKRKERKAMLDFLEKGIKKGSRKVFNPFVCNT